MSFINGENELKRIKFSFYKSDFVFMKTLLKYLFGFKKKKDLVRKELVIGKIAFGVWH